MTDHDGNGSTTSAGPRIDPAQPVDPKSGELRAEKNSLKRFIKVLGPGLDRCVRRRSVLALVVANTLNAGAG